MTERKCKSLRTLTQPTSLLLSHAENTKVELINPIFKFSNMVCVVKFLSVQPTAVAIAPLVWLIINETTYYVMTFSV